MPYASTALSIDSATIDWLVTTVDPHPAFLEVIPSLTGYHNAFVSYNGNGQAHTFRESSIGFLYHRLD